ncbi:MAG: hypothetical protein JWM44_2817 [Bacilli bacterium]|nr:hypothetical protein [Bacilli bacterium]
MGIRVIKTAAAVVIAIYLALFFNLNSPYSAGLLAVLGIDVTKKRGLKNSSVRIIASLLGLLLASLIFYILGYHVWVIAIYVMLVYTLLVKLKLQDGIITSSVVMIRLFSMHMTGSDSVINEIYLLLVGLGTATLINLLYMPNTNPKLEQAKIRVEAMLSTIFKEISQHLKDHENHIWDGKELLSVPAEIEKGYSLAEKSAENTFKQGDGYWEKYFEMRSQQYESVQRMLDLVAQVYQSVPHAQSIALLFDELSGDLKEDYYTGNVEKNLLELENKFKEDRLPLTRDEFEVRSALLQLNLELKNYLFIAKSSKKRKQLQS